MTPQLKINAADLTIGPVPVKPTPTEPRYLPESAYEILPLSDARAARRRQLVAALLGSVAVPEDVDSLGPMHSGTYFALRPQNNWHNWLSGQIALLTFRIERNQRVERRLRDLASLRAIDCWEVDQALLAERIATKLAAKPGATHAALWTSLAGCDWLLARWAELETDDIGGWTTEQRGLARQIYPFETDRLHRPGTIAYHISQLQEQRQRMVEADRVERALVEADLADHLGPAVREIRRTERALQKRLEWCLNEIRTPLPKYPPHPAFKPEFGLTATDETKTEPDHTSNETNPTPPHRI